MWQEIYSGCRELDGEEHEDTLIAANNYAGALRDLRRFEEAKSLLRKTMPVTRRVLGENHHVTLRMRWAYAIALYKDEGATPDDLREAVATLEETERIARRVFGGAHPLAVDILQYLRDARAALSTHEDVGSISDAVGAL